MRWIAVGYGCPSSSASTGVGGSLNTKLLHEVVQLSIVAG
jgi:hypothetical protein